MNKEEAKQIVFKHCIKLKQKPYLLSPNEIIEAKYIKMKFGDEQCREWSLMIDKK